MKERPFTRILIICLSSIQCTLGLSVVRSKSDKSRFVLSGNNNNKNPCDKTWFVNIDSVSFASLSEIPRKVVVHNLHPQDNTTIFLTIRYSPHPLGQPYFATCGTPSASHVIIHKSPDPVSIHSSRAGSLRMSGWTTRKRINHHLIMARGGETNYYYYYYYFYFRGANEIRQ